MKSTRRRALPALATLSAIALALSACGGASDASSNAGAGGEGVQYASDKIAAASKNPEFTFAGPAFKMSDIAGKTIFNIPNNSSIPYIEAVDMEAKKVAESYGATWVEYSTQGLPNEHTAGIDQAINQNADIIILAQGVNAELIVPALERAKAAGIPVLITHTYQNGSSLPATLDGLIAGSITAPFNEAARLGSTAFIPGRFNAWGTLVAVYFLYSGVVGLQMLGAKNYVQDIFYGGALIAAVAISQAIRHKSTASRS